jgi:hypothetical protein
LKALADIIGLSYGKRGSQVGDKDKRKRVIFGEEERLIAFLNNSESEGHNTDSRDKGTCPSYSNQ